MVLAGQLPSTHCAVAPLAEEASFTAARLVNDRELDGPEFFSLSDRMDALGDAASYLTAGSPFGAYFQALLILSDLDPEMNYVCDDAPSARLVRRQRRLMASVALRLRDHAPVQAASALERYYGSPLGRLA